MSLIMIPIFQSPPICLVLRTLATGQRVPRSNPDSSMDVSSGSYSTLNGGHGPFSLLMQNITAAAPPQKNRHNIFQIKTFWYKFFP